MIGLYTLTAPALFPGTIGLTRVVIRPRLTIARIQAVVASYYDIAENEMRSDRRSRDIARPRQVAMYLAKQLTPKSLPEIGRRFGGRDHTTVMHALKQIAHLIAHDGDWATDVEVLRERLG